MLGRKTVLATTGAVASSLLLALAASADYKPTDDGKVANGAKLTGVVTYTGGDRTPNEQDTTSKDPDACGQSRTKEALLVSDSKGLANCVVYLKKVDDGAGKSFTDEQKNVVLDQKTCQFAPHVTLVAEGGSVTFKNSDTVLHNIKSMSALNRAFNLSVAPASQTTQTFRKAEFVKLACSVHSWMSGIIVVMQNPYYAVTKADGSYELDDVPAGTWTVIAQHELLGRADPGQDLTFTAGATQTQNYEFK